MKGFAKKLDWLFWSLPVMVLVIFGMVALAMGANAYEKSPNYQPDLLFAGAGVLMISLFFTGFFSLFPSAVPFLNRVGNPRPYTYMRIAGLLLLLPFAFLSVLYLTMGMNGWEETLLFGISFAFLKGNHAALTSLLFGEVLITAVLLSTGDLYQPLPEWLFLVDKEEVVFPNEEIRLLPWRNYDIRGLNTWILAFSAPDKISCADGEFWLKAWGAAKLEYQKVPRGKFLDPRIFDEKKLEDFLKGQLTYHLHHGAQGKTVGQLLQTFDPPDCAYDDLPLAWERPLVISHVGKKV